MFFSFQLLFPRGGQELGEGMSVTLMLPKVVCGCYCFWAREVLKQGETKKNKNRRTFQGE